ncbi:glycosyltransferase [Stappia sp.]|uniref:glycosyltransferase family 2 protein n=1 Tax=Stappia sp. TaxID=1870903 RepID=UPI0025DAB300|nr:glycosyltransferase [Stappia sp.]
MKNRKLDTRRTMDRFEAHNTDVSPGLTATGGMQSPSMWQGNETTRSARPMDGTPWLSIVIPCFGRQEMLTGLLDQLCGQIGTRADVEVIVVDDGTSPPLKVRVRDTTLVKLLRHERPCGAPAARELGFRNATGRFIHFHDSDDLLGHQWIDAAVRAVRQTPAPDLVVTSRLVMEPGGAVSFWHVRRLVEVAKTTARLRAYQRFINRIGPLGGMIFSRRAAEAITFHRTAASQDWLMYDDALASSEHVHFDDKNYFIFNKTQTIRISNNARSRAKGYVFAARARFRSRRMRRFAARIYCAHGAGELAPVINVRHRWLKRIACELLARHPILAGR